MGRQVTVNDTSRSAEVVDAVERVANDISAQHNIVSNTAHLAVPLLCFAC